MNRTHMVSKALSTHISIVLTQVSVPTEDGSQQSATFTHVLKGPALTCPIIPLADQHFRVHFKPYNLSINNQNPHKQQKKTSAALIVLLKPQTTK
jgi:hypothetical protein